MPPERREPELLADIVERCDEIAVAVVGHSADDLSNDVVIRNAVLYPLVIIGEAASRLPEEFRACHADVPWSEIVGQRNFVVHAYAAVDLGTVWRTVTRSVPQLRDRVMAILRGEFPLVAEALEKRVAGHSTRPAEGTTHTEDAWSSPTVDEQHNQP